MATLCADIKKSRENGKKHTIIVLAEGVMTAQQFAELMWEHGEQHTRVSVLGHIQRGGRPTARDRVLASQLGAKAVELLMEGIGGVCVGVRQDKIIYSDIVETLANGKHVPNLDLYKLNEDISG